MIYTSKRNIIDGINRARAKGYKKSFLFNGSHLVDKDSLNVYDAWDCEIVEEETFVEGPSFALFWFRCKDGIKGYLTKPLKGELNDKLSQFLKRVQNKEQSLNSY